MYQRAGWWLNSSTGVIEQSGLLFVAGFVVTLVSSRGAPRLGWLLPALCLDTAAIATSTVILLRVGPGNLFPIVLAFVQAICTAAVFGGAAAVVVPRLRRRKRQTR